MSTFDAEYHRQFMRQALAEAASAADRGEVPVGAVVALGDRIIASAGNRVLEENDPTAHAEILALREAAQSFGSERIQGGRLYVTLEPCPMCAGAIVLARLRSLYFGAHDAKAGATGTLYAITDDRRLNHRVETLGGMLDDESRLLLQTFFRDRR